MKELALDNNSDQARKILRDSLPPRNSAQRMLDLFFDYQNSVFYVCSRAEAQAQLSLMYEHPEQVSVSWLCQMFLIFAVGIQFDEVGDGDGVTYHELGVKYMDDAVEENPQNTLWVMRAMLLLCFYQPPSKWNSVWIYLDAAIRGAQRFQLDLGRNQLQEISDEEYMEWRQVWLTVISFDRWVAIFLGRPTRIKESISRDAIFKGPPFDFSTSQHVLQNSVTSLSIIAGNILRDMYFTEEFRLNVCRQYKSELSSWLAGLPDSLRQPVESGVIVNVSKDQSETIFNLHFMLIGAWMLLTRPLLLKAVKTRMSSVGFTGPIVSAVTADAAVCVDYAYKFISSASTLLYVSLPPKRTFIPIIFLINAANIMILGAVWKRRQGNKSGFLPDRTREITAIDAATRVLDFCGQRNSFARKYSSLIKDLRNQLSETMDAPYVDEPSPSSAPIPSRPASMSSAGPSYRRQMAMPPPELSPITDPPIETPAFSRGGSTVDQSSTTTSPLTSSQLSQGYYGPMGSLNANLEPWSEDFGMFYNPADFQSQNPNNFIPDTEGMNFLDDIMK